VGGRLEPVGEDIRKGCGRVNMVEICTQYENGKMRSVETIARMGEGQIKRMMEGMNSTMIHCKKFCKCHIVPPVQQE
jgi:hypothetical protein